MGRRYGILALSEASLSRWSDDKPPKSQESPSTVSFQASPPRSRFQIGEHSEDDRFYDIMDIQENLAKLDQDIDGEMVQSLDLIPQKENQRTTGLRSCGITQDTPRHDYHIKLKKIC